MGRLTREERRRVFLAQEKARRAMLRSMARPESTPRAPRTQRRVLLWLVKTAMIATLLAAGWSAYRAVEFHAPESIVETLLPRR
jgi:hypothetical protein